MSTTEFPGGWIVARSKPRQELYAHDNVVRQGYECYVPRFLETRTRKVQILFPGYILVYTTGAWRFLTGTFGVMDVVLNGDRPSRVPEYEIHKLKARENRKGYVDVPDELFAQGQRVRIRKGPFANEFAIYQGMLAKDRVVVLLSALGRETPVKLREQYVEAA